ncbi:MAG: hypothetical protein GXO62_02530, partial [Epsilonproteobacteria bacterium]|nr:hypothetical protein [Campylobacterota bacterium]
AIDKKEKKDVLLLKKIKKIILQLNKDDVIKYIQDRFYSKDKNVKELIELILDDEMRGLNLKKLRR